jgi:serine/threonine protein phosphatase PrpC
VKISTASKMGRRTYQEDRYVVHHTGAGVLLAVMDGHGGEDVADVCKDYVGHFFDLTLVPLDNGDPRAFDKALALTIWELNCITNEYHSGCTISLAFIPKSEDKVFIATLGDSPVIVRSPSGVTWISESHNARTNLEEREAAEKRGGIYHGGYIWCAPHGLYPMGDSGRGLQMTRSLGDTEMGPVISRDPQIEIHALGKFVLVATDGCFDPGHENESQAVADVIALIDQGGDAKAIVDRAVQLPTEDNATAVLLTKE